MSTERAVVQKEKQSVFETVLSSPGMSEKCRLALLLSRKNILLLCRLMEAGWQAKEGEWSEELMGTLSREAVEEWKTIHQELLEKAGLTAFYGRLKLL